MTPRASRRLAFLVVLVPALAVWLGGIRWGLPSHDVDPFLFGRHPVWSGDQVLDKSGGWSLKTTQGSDQPQNAVVESSTPRLLNATDADRAQWILRYRLYTFHPDEMYTFRALGQMRPAQRDFDPRMYHYGGLWFYPIGALLKVASVAHLARVGSDLRSYVDHPEAFGRFYLIARLYVVAWAVVGAWAVYRITHALAPAHWAAPASATATFAFLPVVVNMIHEVKPHLPGLVLVLLTVLAAAAYVRDGGAWRALRAGAVGGLAVGMIITGAAGWLTFPLMVLLRRDDVRRRIGNLLLAGLAAFACYAVTNPYVIIHLLGSRQLLAGNASGLSGFYNLQQHSGAIATATRLILEGATPAIAILAVGGGILFLVRRAFPWRLSPMAWLLLLPALVNAVQVYAFASGKPGEYGRFALLLDAMLAILAVRSVTAFVRHPAARVALLALLPLCALPGALRYLTNFVRDSTPINSRLAEARRLASIAAQGASPDRPLTLAVVADPAPYSLPPVDLWTWRVLLTPRGMTLDEAARQHVADVLVQAVDDPTRPHPAPPPDGFVELDPTLPPTNPPALISWAGKPFRTLVRRELVPP